VDPQSPPARASSPVLRALAIVAVAVAATVIVAWLLGAFRPSTPRSAAVENSSATPATTASERPSPIAPTPAATASPVPGTSPGGGASAAPDPDPVLIGVGDIATCGGRGDEATALLVERTDGIVFTLGDNAYDTGSPAEFRDCYEPSWGRVKDRTAFPVPGNHDYGTDGAAGYRAYFGDAATPDGETFYSRDVGAWHVVVLDANCAEPGVGCGPDSKQVRWLRADLAASDARCTLALWHQPRFSSGMHGDDPGVAPFWDALYAAGADLVLNGHDHDYERFAPQAPDGSRDPDRGITEIVAGTGGGEMRDFGTPVPNSLVRRDRLFGVLQLTLHPAGWTSRFISTDGSFPDEDRGRCH
jgi:alkaline phosphatase